MSIGLAEYAWRTRWIDRRRSSSARGITEPGIERLAPVLVETGHLERRGARFANAPGAIRRFTSRGAVDYRPGLAWTSDAWTIMATLPHATRRGEPEMLH